MVMGGVKLKHAEIEKYLGDWVHELGCKESISATIKERMQKQIGKCDDIIQIAEVPFMSALGNVTIGIRLYESQVIPALLFNSESWIGLNNTHLTDLQNFQDKFLRKLMRLPPTTPKAILHWDGIMETMKWRIAARKLQFIRKTMEREDDVMCKQALTNEYLLNLKGLGHEGAVLAQEAGLLDPRFNLTTKDAIKEGTGKAGLKERKC